MSTPTSNLTSPRSTPGGWSLESSYATLPAPFFSEVTPTSVREPRCVLFNEPLARMLGLDPEQFGTREGVDILAGNRLPPGARPLAQAYCGHQFGSFTRLGDGRALLLGEQRTPGGKLFDIQLKGSGPTPYSRRGDGRAALGPMLREYILSEAMAGLGIPTTRSLAVVATGETVWRQQPLPGAVLTRVAASHLRVGTFEFAAAYPDLDLVPALTKYAISRHAPQLFNSPDSTAAFLEQVAAEQADLLSRWLAVGFIHGVMNTDNMSVAGETIDYGPCAFLDAYDPSKVFSSIDHQGRYAYGRQPSIAQWNLSSLANALLSQLHPDEEVALKRAEEILVAFGAQFERQWLKRMGAKIGLAEVLPEDAELITDLLAWMFAVQADFTCTFRRLDPEPVLQEIPFADARYREWHDRWKIRLQRQAEPLNTVRTRMRSNNPMLIPRNHQVERVLSAAVVHGDLEPTRQLVGALQKPWDVRDPADPLCLPPAPEQCVTATFCGT